MTLRLDVLEDGFLGARALVVGELDLLDVGALLLGEEEVRLADRGQRLAEAPDLRRRRPRRSAMIFDSAALGRSTEP